jgi:Inhibitor of growth proteins N-terminal histone-binding
MRPSQRQTRTNPTRTSKTVGSSLRQNPPTSNPPVTATNAPEHGFYPAIAHFTDAITSLPREFRRHTSLLKEVDAKAWAPEAHLQTLLAACVASKPPSSLPSEVQSTTDPTAAASDPSIQPVNADGTAYPAADNASQISAPSVHELQSFEHRRLFYNLRSTLTEMMISMDEKNHLIYGANEDLSRQLKRLTAIYPHIADEVSEEARLGSLTHWAYIDNKPPARVNVATSRKEAAVGLAAMHDTDIASRSESRREAMLARKQRQNHLDSDFDDPRPTKRASINGKLKKVGEAVESVSGLGISGAAAPPMKRKRVEKPAAAAAAASAGAVAMERSLSGAVGGRASSREPSLQEGTKKRKAPTAATAAARKRHDCLPVPERGIILTLSRINTANSATNSPKLASSPLLGSSGKEPHRNSPAPGNGRPHSSRVRQNSTQTRPPSSASNKNNRNGIGVSASTPELHNLSAMTGKSTEEIKGTMKESVNNKGQRLIEEGEDASINGTNGMKGGILLERSASKGGAVGLKREETCASDENPPKCKAAASPRLPPPTLLNTEHSTRPEREREPRVSRARSSKTSTPVVNTFAESESTTREHHNRADNRSKRPSSSSFRSARSKDSLHDSLSPSGLPPKRSHKKGAGLAAQAAVLQAKLAKQQSSNSSGQKADTPASSTSSPPAVTAGENQHHRHHNPSASSPPLHTSSLEHSDTLFVNDLPGSEPNHISEEEVDSSGEEPRYCYCQQVSYGEMVACDADDCPREWFHLECVGLGRAPGRNARWFCEECKERLRLGGSGGGSNGVTALGQTVRRGR